MSWDSASNSKAPGSTTKQRVNTRRDKDVSGQRVEMNARRGQLERRDRIEFCCVSRLMRKELHALLCVRYRIAHGIARWISRLLVVRCQRCVYATLYRIMVVVLRCVSAREGRCRAKWSVSQIRLLCESRRSGIMLSNDLSLRRRRHRSGSRHLFRSLLDLSFVGSIRVSDLLGGFEPEARSDTLGGRRATRTPDVGIVRDELARVLVRVDDLELELVDDDARADIEVTRTIPLTGQRILHAITLEKLAANEAGVALELLEHLERVVL
jgi:hypothetical protein